MINATPTGTTLSDEHYPCAVVLMREYGVSFLAIEKVWDILRDFSPQDNATVLCDLKRDEITRKWFAL